MKHVGMHPCRLEHNPIEAEFAEAWREANKYGRVLEYLLSPDNRPEPVSLRDEIVAATVIQWLGSPVGQNFVRSILEKPCKAE